MRDTVQARDGNTTVTARLDETTRQIHITNVHQDDTTVTPRIRRINGEIWHQLQILAVTSRRNTASLVEEAVRDLLAKYSGKKN